MLHVKFKETKEYDRNNKGMYSCFYVSKKFLDCLTQWGGKNAGDGENLFFEALAKIFLFTSESYLWPTFY